MVFNSAEWMDVYGETPDDSAPQYCDCGNELTDDDIITDEGVCEECR